MSRPPYVWHFLLAGDTVAIVTLTTDNEKLRQDVASLSVELERMKQQVTSSSQELVTLRAKVSITAHMYT